MKAIYSDNGFTENFGAAIINLASIGLLCNLGNQQIGVDV